MLALNTMSLATSGKVQIITDPFEWVINPNFNHLTIYCYVDHEDLIRGIGQTGRALFLRLHNYRSEALRSDKTALLGYTRMLVELGLPFYLNPLWGMASEREAMEAHMGSGLLLNDLGKAGTGRRLSRVWTPEENVLLKNHDREALLNRGVKPREIYEQTARYREVWRFVYLRTNKAVPEHFGPHFKRAIESLRSQLRLVTPAGPVAGAWRMAA